MRWVIRIVVALVVLLVVAVGGGYWWISGSVSNIDGRLTLDGLTAEVEITRDSNAIPHIIAGNEMDAWYGLGYAHAQDRLWQMEMNRRIGAGRLSEILGEKTVPTDRFLRTLSVYHFARRTVAKMKPEDLAAYESYAAGVNAFINNPGGPLPPEFIVLGVKPEPWKPADSVVWAKMMAWDLGANWRNEILRFRMAKAGLSQQQIVELYPPYPGDAPVSLPDLASLYEGVEDFERQFAAIPDAILPDPANGSNNWVVSGQRTASGKPLLANDPHLGLSAPAIWYFAHVQSPGMKVIGATLPGIPAVVLGRNDRIAWGFTNTGPDVQDMFIERLVKGDGTRYLTPDGDAGFITRKEIIKVKDAADVVFDVRSSRHGPIISDASGSAAEVAGKGHVLAFSWTALRDDSGAASAFRGMNKAKNWEQFVSALRDFDVPQQNMVYADIEGNIGYYAPGRVPVRKKENPIKGFMPSPGWKAEYDWDGYIPFDELPHIYNPKRGFVITANHKVVADSYPHQITLEWTTPHRARRIEALLTAREKHTVESFRSLQSDVKSLMATDILPRLLEVKPTTTRAVQAFTMLTHWNGEMKRNMAEPLIFNAWMRKLTQAVYADELGDLFQPYWGMRPIFMKNVLSGGQDHWCDNVKTKTVEDCNQLIGQSLVDAVVELGQEMENDDPASWRWGQRHRAHSDHNPFTHVGALADIFDLYTPNDGDGYTVNVGRHNIADPKNPYRQYHGPSLRAIYDLSDLDRSRWIHSTGQSGNTLSDYYSNFVSLWRDVRDLPMTMDARTYKAGAIGTLILMPKQ